MPTRPPPDAIPAPPDEVARRLEARLFPIRSVWFPTRAELRDWSASGSPLYLRWLGSGRFEIGPRVDNMWAACFSPVIRGALHADGGGTRLTWERAFPRLTRAVQAAWAVLLAGWLAALAPAIARGEESPGTLVFWVLLAGATAASTAVGGKLGGRALDDALPWLVEVASEEPVDEDW